MISNYLVGNYKFVLFVDHIVIERNSRQIIEAILSEQNLSYELTDGKNGEITNKTNFIFDQPISKMELDYSPQEIFTIIQRLKMNDNATQIFGWVSSKNVQSKILISFLEHMSEAIVTIKSNDTLSILSKSKSGSVKLKEYQHELIRGKTQIKEIKVNSKVQEQQVSVDDTESSTFKIGQFTTQELEAKRNLILPFEKISIDTPEKKEAKIMYTPENVDDFDEEDDPDNDLQF